MPVQSVGQSVNLPQVAPTATKTFAPRPGDTLSQASKPESGDGFIMSILKPIGRFFANLIRSIFCCCSYSPGLPKFTAAELNDWLGYVYEVVQKSDTSFELTQGDITFTVEIVPYEGSFAVKLKGDDAFWSSDCGNEFYSSSTLLFEGITGDNVTGAVKNSDGLWVHKGPVENVLAIKGGVLDIRLLLPSGSKFVPIHLRGKDGPFKWIIKDLEKSPELLVQIVEWAKATRCLEATIFHTVQLKAKAEADTPLAQALLAAGFKEEVDGVYALELPKLKD